MTRDGAWAQHWSAGKQALYPWRLLAATRAYPSLTFSQASNRNPRAFSTKLLSGTSAPNVVLVCGVAVPIRMPDTVLLSTKRMRPLNCISPFLQLLQVSLCGSRTLWHISHSLGIPQYRRTQGLGLLKISIYYRSPQIMTSK